MTTVILPDILTIGEVARLFGIDPKTAKRHDELLEPFRTPGGHRRYRRDVVLAQYNARLYPSPTVAPDPICPQCSDSPPHGFTCNLCGGS